MIKYPKAIEELVDDFTNLPSIGKKTALRYALHIYNKMSDEHLAKFIKDLTCLKQDVHICKECGNICEDEICQICSDSKRNHRQILVVESIKDLYTIENIGEYNGIYHVLGAAISFAKGIGIDELNLDSLINKVKNKEVDELILETNETIEGETTARYIKELLVDSGVKITRIAYGLPVGGEMAYADSLTLVKAMEGRREY